MKKIKIYFALCVLALAASCATTGKGDKSQALAYYKLGVAYLNESKIQQAFVEFHKAYEIDPDNKEILNAIGYIYLIHFDDPRKSLEYFEKAVKIDPDYSDAYNNMGYAYEKSGRFEQAITYYKKALSNPVYPTADRAYVNLGNSYYRLHKYQDALAAFKEALKRDPNFFLPYMRLALCYNAQGRYGDAATAITQGITLDPLYKGDKDKAFQDFTLKKIKSSGFEEQDVRDYLEILRY